MLICTDAEDAGQSDCKSPSPLFNRNIWCCMLALCQSWCSDLFLHSLCLSDLSHTHAWLKICLHACLVKKKFHHIHMSVPPSSLSHLQPHQPLIQCCRSINIALNHRMRSVALWPKQPLLQQHHSAGSRKATLPWFCSLRAGAAFPDFNRSAYPLSPHVSQERDYALICCA